jgi:hypothetical protein
MKKNITLILLCCLWTAASAQESMEKVMEKRAREMHRVMGLTDKEQWKKFVKENYTQALIDKPMRSEQRTSDSDKTSKSSSESGGNLDAKAEMFRMLNQDFGSSKIVSIKPKDGSIEMILGTDDSKGIFTIKFEKTAPYLIDGLGVEVNAGD